MPEYQYKCYKCEEIFEVFQKITEKPLKKCKNCGKLGLQRVIQTVHGHVFKSANEMKTLNDLAKYNTDKLTTGEKQKKDHEYAEGSKLAKDKLKKQNMEKPWYHGSNEPKNLTQKLAKATDKQKQDYIKDGKIP